MNEIVLRATKNYYFHTLFRFISCKRLFQVIIIYITLRNMFQEEMELHFRLDVILFCVDLMYIMFLMKMIVCQCEEIEYQES